MKRTTAFTLFFRWVAPLVVLVAAGLFIYSMGSQQKPGRKKAPPRKSIPVEVVQPQPHNGTLDIVANGVAIPYREVKISAQVGGEVIFKADSLSPGQYVRQNETLLKIDPQTYEIEVARLEKEHAKAEQELANLRVRAVNTERLLKLNREMVKLRTKNVERLNRLQAASASTAAEADSVRMAWLTTSQQMTAQENLLREFSSQTKTLEMTRDLVLLQLKRARLDLKRTTITAPFSGVVIANHVEQNGAVVPGMPVATIEDTSMVEVRCSLRSDDLEFILQNAPVTGDASSGGQSAQGSQRVVTTSTQVGGHEQDAGDAYRLPATPVTLEYERGGSVYRWDGTLSRQDGLGVDSKTRTTPVRIRVSNPTGIHSESSLADGAQIPLLRGMFVKVKLHCEPRATLLSVPEAVVRPGKNVWVMRDEKLHIEPIRIARIEGGKAFFNLAQSRVAASDKVISSPVPNARDGIAISLLKQRKPGGKKTIGKKATGKTTPGEKTIDGKATGGKPTRAKSPGKSRAGSDTGQQESQVGLGSSTDFTMPRKALSS